MGKGIIFKPEWHEELDKMFEEKKVKGKEEAQE
jgi:hypothetical protein